MRRRAGFTLIEVIITIAIAPIAFGAVFAISGFAAQSNRHSATNQDIQFRAQAILENVKARGDTAFLADAADASKPMVTGFVRTVIEEGKETPADKTDDRIIQTYVQEDVSIMGRNFDITLMDSSVDTERISSEISPENSSLLLPASAMKFELDFHSEPGIWCGYNGERFYPYAKTEADGSERDHFYLIVQGRVDGDGDAVSQTVDIKMAAGEANPTRPVVFNVIYEKDAVGDLNFSGSLPASAYTSPVVPEAERVNFPESLDWAAVSRKPEGDLIGWRQMEEHSVTLTFTDETSREWSSYTTSYETVE